MDATEAIAEQALRHLGFRDISYEPDGNVPPDFLVDGRIAVEVRRLNQQENSSGRHRGIEESTIPLIERLQALFAGAGPPKNGISWYVRLRFQRPIEDWKTLKPRIQSQIIDKPDAMLDETGEIQFGPNLSLSLNQTAKATEERFHLGVVSDHDRATWTLAEIERSIQVCADQKAQKIAKVRSRYPEWWLMLVDQIGYSLGTESRADFRSSVALRHNWDRIVLVNPLDPSKMFEISPS